MIICQLLAILFNPFLCSTKKSNICLSRPFRSREVSNTSFEGPKPSEAPFDTGTKRGKTLNVFHMCEKTLDLFELLREFPEANLTVHAGDLGHFARELLAEARQDFERERAAIAEGKTEEYLTPEMVKTLLRISESTLYRMAKAKILVPVFVGGQKRYRRSDIDKILSPS